MAPCNISSLNPEGKGNDPKQNIQGSSEGWHGRCRSMTDEGRALYGEQVDETDSVFDVPVYPDDEDDDECGHILLFPLTTAEEIERCNKVVRFAIDYVNRTQGRTLQLVRAIQYMLQAAGPLNHYITFAATDSSTGVTEVYQTLVYQYIPWETSEVDIFRRKADQQVDEADLVQHLAIFAVYHYNKTEGDDLKYVNVTSFERLESSYSISFKAKNPLTGDVQIYETEIVYRDPMQNSLVKTFRKSRIQWTNKEEEFRFFAIFAVHHYNKTKGEQLELIEVGACHQYAESYYNIAFKARDLSTCMVEHYETEVVSTAPEYISMVKMFKKLSINQGVQEIQGANISTYHEKEGGKFSASTSKQPDSGPSTSQKNNGGKKATGSTKKHKKQK